MGKDHLVPVVKPDVNGKMVTRHVKPVQASTTAPALSVPPTLGRSVTAASGGTLSAAKGRRELKSAIVMRIPDYEAGYMRHSKSELWTKVKSCPDSVVEAFWEARERIDDVTDQSSLDRLLIKCFDCDTDPVDIESAIYYFENSSSGVRDNIDEYFEFGAKKIADYPIGNLISAVSSYDLEGFYFDPARPINKQDERTVEQCKALQYFHYAAEKAEQWEPVALRAFADDGTLLSADLAQMVVDSPEKVGDMIAIIEDRMTLDAELISSIVNSSASALREGNL